MSVLSLTERDQRSLWHPYTQHGWRDPLLPVTRAQGAYLYLEDGREILDAIASWWVNLHGHSHPQIAVALSRQASELEHTMFAGFTHRPAIELAERLLSVPSIQKAGLTKVFYSDNGSTAVEVALKMAYQYQLHRGQTGRSRFLALQGSYHGDTLGAMAVSDSGFETVFRPLLAPVDTIVPEDLHQLEAMLSQSNCPYAAFIFEPMIQGAGGMRTYSAAFLAQAVKLCAQYGVLCIADEVFTGFYRTGKFFAFEHAEILPDLICVSKGLTAGFLPLSATLATSRVFEAFLHDELAQAFLHGHSYTANPIACAAGIASFDLLMDSDCQRRITEISAKTRHWVETLSGKPGVARSWQLGTIGAVEMVSEESGYFARRSREIRHRALARGVLLRPLGTVLYSVPPYCTTDAELEMIYTTMGQLAEESLSL